MTSKGKWKLKLMTFGFKYPTLDLSRYIKLVHILEWCYCDNNPVLHLLNCKWINHFHILIGSDYDFKGQNFHNTLGIQKLERISHMREMVNICIFPVVGIKEGTEPNSSPVVRN